MKLRIASSIFWNGQRAGRSGGQASGRQRGGRTGNRLARDSLAMSATRRKRDESQTRGAQTLTGLLIRQMVRLLLFLTLVVASALAAKSASQHYGVVLDAGSSGTRVHVYSYTIDTSRSRVVSHAGGVRWDPFPRFGVEHNKKLRPGLSTYGADPEKSVETTRGLLDFARGHVPKEYRAQTPIILSATAGLRRLPLSQQQALIA